MLGTKLLLSRISKNTPLFGKYLVTLIGKLVALSLLHYNAFILPRLEDSSVKLLFGAILSGIIYDIWKCHKTWESRFNWKNYLLREGYSDTLIRLQVVPDKVLRNYSRGNLPILIKQASNVPLLLFEAMDKLFDLGCGVFAFILIASWGNLTGFIQLIIGLVIAIKTINTNSISIENNTSKDSFKKYKNHINNDIILEYIIREVKEKEHRRIRSTYIFWRKFTKAYIIILFSVILTILRTVEFDNLISIITHAYIFSQFISLIELWVYIEVPRQQAIVDNIILEELYNLSKISYT